MSEAIHRQQPCAQTSHTLKFYFTMCSSQESDGVAGGLWADNSSTDVSKHVGVSSCYIGSMTREQAVLKLQAGARGYLARKQLRLQRQQAAESLVLVQVRCVGRGYVQGDALQHQQLSK